MVRGFYSAASALLAGLFRQELLSHNIANINLAGYKSLNTSMDEFEPKLLSRMPGVSMPGTVGVEVGQTSLGVAPIGTETYFAEGSLRDTKQPFDLAINGDGFFRISTPNGERFTRDGRFTRDENGNLATVDGYLLLGVDGQPVVVPQGETAIDADGVIRVDNQAGDQIALAAFANPVTDLQRDGANTFAALGEATASTAAIRQGMLEMSNVDASRTMAQMISVARAYEAAQRAVQLQDEMTGKAVNEIGRL